MKSLVSQSSPQNSPSNCPNCSKFSMRGTKRFSPCWRRSAYCLACRLTRNCFKSARVVSRNFLSSFRLRLCRNSSRMSSREETRSSETREVLCVDTPGSSIATLSEGTGIASFRSLSIVSATCLASGTSTRLDTSKRVL